MSSHQQKGHLLNILALLVGAFLIFAVVLDILWTTLWVKGDAGPLTGRLTTHVSRAISRLERRHHGRSLLGPAVLVTTIAVWVFLLWAGWALLFSSDHSSVISTSTETPAGWVERTYFVGYVIFTLGLGDFKPNGNTWQILTTIASGTGLLLITLIITYVMSVLSAVVQKRSFANHVMGVGRTAEAFVQTGWNGQNFHMLDLPLSNYASVLSQITEQHFVYPILHYYHGAQSVKSPAVGVAVLDEALTLLQFGIPSDLRPNRVLLASTRAAIEDYLNTLYTFVNVDQPAPPLPDLTRFRREGIPTVSDDEFRASLEQISERRGKLVGLVRHEGWDWPNR